MSHWKTPPHRQAQTRGSLRSCPAAARSLERRQSRYQGREGGAGAAWGSAWDLLPRLGGGSLRPHAWTSWRPSQWVLLRICPRAREGPCFPPAQLEMPPPGLQWPPGQGNGVPTARGALRTPGSAQGRLVGSRCPAPGDLHHVVGWRWPGQPSLHTDAWYSVGLADWAPETLTWEPRTR